MPEVVEQSKITPHGIVIKKDKQEEEKVSDFRN